MWLLMCWDIEKYMKIDLELIRVDLDEKWWRKVDLG